MSIAWTGHRPDLFADPERARRRVDETARAAIVGASNPQFLCGGQRGVDLWAAAAGFETGVPVRLILPMPMADFTRDWSDPERGDLTDAVRRAAAVEIVDRDGSLGRLAFDRRNELLVRRADRLVAVWTRLRRGGTFYTLCAAWQSGTAVQETVMEPAGGEIPRGRGI